jgi:hypothetical protein
VLEPLHRVFTIAEQRSISKEEVLEMRQLAVAALCALERRSESGDFTGRRWHSVLHMADIAEYYGPLRWLSESAYEQAYGVRKREGRKRNAQAAGVAAQAEWRATLQICTAVSPSLLRAREAVSQLRAGISPTAVRTDGGAVRLTLCERRPRNLSPREQQHLLLAIRQTELAPLWSRYQDWCVSPTGKVAATWESGQLVARPFGEWFDSAFCVLTAAEKTVWAPFVLSPVPTESLIFGRAVANGWTFYSTESDMELCRKSVNDGVRVVEGGISYVGTTQRLEVVRAIPLCPTARTHREREPLLQATCEWPLRLRSRQ